MRPSQFRLPALLLAALALASPAAALDATGDGAKQLAATLERYFGKQDAADPALKVTPQGDGYQIAFDLGKFAKPLENLGVKLEGGSLLIGAAPQADGNWRVTAANLPKLALAYSGQTQTVQYDGFKYDGVFSPKLAAFLTANVSAQKSSSTAVNPGATATSSISEMSMTMASSPAGPDQLNWKTQGSSKDYTLDVQLSAAKEGPAPGKINFHAATFTSTTAADAMRWGKILDLWAFLVAHPSRETMAAAQADFKSQLRTAAPLFEKLAGEAQLSDLKLETPVGPFGAKSATVRVAATGLVTAASIGEDFSFVGVSTPPGLVPAWASGLTPTDLSVGFRIEGLDLAASSKEFIEVFNLNSPEFLGAPDSLRIFSLLTPGGSFKVVIPPGRATSTLLDVTYDGVGIIPGPQRFKGSANIGAKGVDATLEAMKKAMATDKSVAQAFAGLTLAKGLAKPGANGALTWAIEFDSEGSVKINGAPFPLGGKAK